MACCRYAAVSRAWQLAHAPSPTYDVRVSTFRKWGDGTSGGSAVTFDACWESAAAGDGDRSQPARATNVANRAGGSRRGWRRGRMAGMANMAAVRHLATVDDRRCRTTIHLSRFTVFPSFSGSHERRHP